MLRTRIWNREQPESNEFEGVIHAEAHAAGGFDSKGKLPFAAKGHRCERLCASRPLAVTLPGLPPAAVSARHQTENKLADSRSTTVLVSCCSCMLILQHVLLLLLPPFQFAAATKAAAQL